jgi:hypothetical protein
MLITMAGEMRGLYEQRPPRPISAQEAKAFRIAMAGVDYNELVECVALWPYALWRRDYILEYERRKKAGMTNYENLDGFRCKHAVNPAKMVLLRDEIMDYVRESRRLDDDDIVLFFNRRVVELKAQVAAEVGYVLRYEAAPEPEPEPEHLDDGLVEASPDWADMGCEEDDDLRL